MLFNQLPVHIFEATSHRAARFEDDEDDMQGSLYP